MNIMPWFVRTLFVIAWVILSWRGEAFDALLLAGDSDEEQQRTAFRAACAGRGLQFVRHVCVVSQQPSWRPLRDMRRNITRRLIIYTGGQMNLGNDDDYRRNTNDTSVNSFASFVLGGSSLTKGDFSTRFMQETGFPDVQLRSGLPPSDIPRSRVPIHFIKPTCPANLYHLLHEMLIGLYSLLHAQSLTGGHGGQGRSDGVHTSLHRWPSVLLTYNPRDVDAYDSHCLSLSPLRRFWDALPIMNARAWFDNGYEDVCYDAACFGLPKSRRMWNAFEYARFMTSRILPRASVSCAVEGSGAWVKQCIPGGSEHDIVIVVRRARRIVNAEMLASVARRAPGVRSVRIIDDMGGLSIADQVTQMACSTSVLVTVHGAEVMWGFFLGAASDDDVRKKKHVIEVTWPEVRFHSLFDNRWHESYHRFFAAAAESGRGDEQRWGGVEHHVLALDATPGAGQVLAVSRTELLSRGVPAAFLQSERHVRKYSDVKVPVTAFADALRHALE